MGTTTGITWTQATWNPWRGCTKVSPGCQKCYMFREQERYGRDPSVVVRAAPATFNLPLSKTMGNPRLIFTCSWSDFFHEAADEWRPEAWGIIRRTLRHTYQILTKRPDRIAAHLPPDWGNGYPNVWLGVSIEMQLYASRIEELAKVPARIHWVSAEPLLGPLDLTRHLGAGPEGMCDWVVAGGESDFTSPRPCDSDWLRSLRDQCATTRVPFFLKQLGGTRHCVCHGVWGCDLLDGKQHHEFPRVREEAK